MEQWHIRSKKMHAVVNQAGAMLGQLVVDMGNGLFQPLALAPWVNDPNKDTLVPILRNLQGEWLCVPFGIKKNLENFSRINIPQNIAALDDLVDNDVPHGITSNLDWELIEHTGDSVKLLMEFPVDYPIKRVIRIIKLNDFINGVEMSCEVIARTHVLIPIGIHPTFSVSTEPYQTQIQCAGYSIGKTYPIEFESSSEFKIGQTFTSLSAVPRTDGNLEDATKYPFAEDREELVQLLNIDGVVSVERYDVGYKSILEWESEKLPHCCLWMSCKGRSEYPWLNRHLALGVEPTHSFFDLNPALAMNEQSKYKHGLVEIHDNKPFTMNYSIRFEKL